MTQHALTVDLEDWHQLLHRRVTGEDMRPSKHVVGDTHRLLDLLDEAAVRATFFVVGSVAETYPDLVREVARRGHEIGSHSYRHELIFRLRPEEFRADVARSREHRQQLTGQPLLGFRAPEFSVGHLRHWSFAILAEAGFAYDSSVFPVGGTRYGIPNVPRRPFRVETPSGALWEFPLATWELGGRRLPVAGGTYFRLLPQSVLRAAVQQAEQSQQHAVLYFHPYEFHRGWLYLGGLTWRQRVHPANVRFGALHNVATRSVGARLRALLAEFKFVPLEELHRQLLGGANDPAGELLGTSYAKDSASS